MSGGRGRRGGHGGGGGGGGGHGGGDSRWLVTYADLLTLLMVLFLVLWVISTIDLAKFEKFKSGLGDFGNPSAEAAAGPGGGGTAGSDPCESTTGKNKKAAASGEEAASADTEAPAEDEAAAEEAAPADTEAPADGETATPEAPAEGETASTEAPAEGEAAAEGESTVDPNCLGSGKGGDAGNGSTLTSSDLPEVAAEVKAAVEAAGLPDVVDVSIQERGIVIMVTTDNVLFASGSADIGPDGAATLAVLAPTLMEFDNDIVVEGHTDKRPLRREGYDNWDLSVDRAVSVIKLLRDQFGFESSRLSARGFGETRPVAEGDDEASLARNRRVEIVILAGDTTTGDPTAADGASSDGSDGTDTTEPATDETVTTEPATATSEPATETQTETTEATAEG